MDPGQVDRHLHSPDLASESHEMHMFVWRDSIFSSYVNRHSLSGGTYKQLKFLLLLRLRNLWPKIRPLVGKVS